MSEVENSAETIVVKVTAQDVTCESPFGIEGTVFWLETAKKVLLDEFVGSADGQSD
ncbi:MAG TPA: hypothetical protein VJ742_12320 [Nitrososphaera sp.]|nr:hypothetical protein [Nitrososphaera sp.]